MQRSAKEIKVKPSILNSKKVNVEIGAIEQKDSPDTIYVSISFWAKPKGELTKEESAFIRRTLEIQIKQLYRKACNDFIEEKIGDVIIPKIENNIFILKIPENFYYNKSKKNFINMEVHINTKNIESEEKYPLNNKVNTKLFDSALSFVKMIISNDLFKGRGQFIVTAKNKA